MSLSRNLPYQRHGLVGTITMATRSGAKLNPTIPGQISAKGLDRICEIASSLSDGAVIVETGSLYGLSSWHWSHNAPPSSQVFCIDPWERRPWIIEKVEKRFKCAEFSLDAFLSYTNDCDNIIPIVGKSPDVARGWRLPIDVYFDDSVHSNPMFRRNLTHWRRFVKPGGWLCGDDYSPSSFPDIVSEVSALSSELGVPAEVHGSVWSIRVPG